MRDAKPDRRDLLLTLAKLHPIWAPPHQAVRVPRPSRSVIP